MSLRLLLSVLALTAAPALAVAADPTSSTPTQAPAAVAAPTPAADAAAPAQADGKPEEKKICKRAGVTGSRTDNNKKICLTRQQWRDLERAS